MAGRCSKSVLVLIINTEHFKPHCCPFYAQFHVNNVVNIGFDFNNNLVLYLYKEEGVMYWKVTDHIFQRKKIISKSFQGVGLGVEVVGYLVAIILVEVFLVLVVVVVVFFVIGGGSNHGSGQSVSCCCIVGVNCCSGGNYNEVSNSVGHGVGASSGGDVDHRFESHKRKKFSY